MALLKEKKDQITFQFRLKYSLIWKLFTAPSWINKGKGIRIEKITQTKILYPDVWFCALHINIVTVVHSSIPLLI